MVLSLQDDGQVRVNMGEPIWEPAQIPFTANKFEKNYILRTDIQTVLCGVVSMGNPHCVLQVENIQTANVNELGLYLNATNVSQSVPISVLCKSSIEIISN